MKRVGILYDKESKKVFLLPKEVKTLTSKGIEVNVLTGLGNCIDIADSEYSAAGAKILGDWKSLINSSDILLKTNSFNSKEIPLMNKKIAISMANYLVNVDMLYYMLQNNVTGIEWCGLTDRSGYVLFDKLEEAKASFIMKAVKNALANGLAKKAKDKVKYPEHPKMLILNATFCGVALAKLAIDAGYEVTIADSDASYLSELKSSLKKLKTMSSNYDKLVEAIKEYNVFVNTAISPIEKTKLRITREMGKSMPKGSLMIDASCELGYAFHFVKKYASDKFEWLSKDKFFYLVPADITNFIAKEASKIISTNSIDYLLSVIEKGVDNNVIWKITNCQDGKVVNSTLNTKLHLY